MRTAEALTASLVGLCLFGGSNSGWGQSAPRPNIILILADDLGWGSVGFQGQTKILTPRIDALAAEGRRFSAAYCPASLCAPTRAAMLSGFHSGHTFVDRNGTDIAAGYRPEDVFFSQRLRDAGYRTAAFGKWGLGSDSTNDTLIAPNSLPAPKGFDTFYGYLSHTIAHDFTPAALWRNDPGAANGVRKETYSGNYSHDTIAAEAEAFIRANAGDPDPFLLYVPFTIPHFDLDEIAALPGYFDAYASVPGAGNWTDKAKKYAAMITRMDASIGRLMDALNDPDGNGDQSDSIAANTLVIFTSDNGATDEDATPVAFFAANGPYRGGKRDLWDGGTRVPMIYRWPGTITPGNSTRVTDLCDIAPTLTELAGTSMPPGIDGVSLLPTLTGEGIQRPRDFITFEHHEADSSIDNDTKDPIWAIRRADHKLIKFSDGTLRLYDLAASPGETATLSNSTLTATLTTLALGERVEEPDAHTVEYRNWTGGNGADPALDANWSGTGAPAAHWSAVMRNAGPTDALSVASTSLSFLGLEIAGQTARQTLVVAPGQTVSARNGFRIVGNGRLVLNLGAAETIRWTEVGTGGVLAGSGNLTGSVYNAGVAEPGMPADMTPPAAREGTLSVAGDWIQEAGGRVRIGIAGSGGKGVGHDLIAVGGALVGGGTLEVQLLDGYIPAAGQSFDILDFVSCSGAFTLDLPALPAHLEWQTSALATTGTLSVRLRPGFHTWISGFGLPESERGPTDDPDGDGISNLEEYALSVNADPISTASAPRPEVQIEGEQLQMRYVRARADISYSPETTTTTLQTNSWTTEGVQTTSGAVGEFVTAWVEMSPGTTRQFLRLRLGVQ